MLLNILCAFGGAVAAVVSQTVYGWVKAKVVAPAEKIVTKL
jgi:hypothetical protein